MLTNYLPTPFSEITALLKEQPNICETIVKNCLVRCQEKEDLNAFIRIYAEEALAFAHQITNKYQAGEKLGKLAGMVVGIKDLICYKDHPLTCASKILGNFVAQFNATAVERILAADGIILGHLNCDAFGMGSSNENSDFGPVKNGLDPTKVSGGSSGGSAVAVQTGMCHVSLGTDTGGSVRQPAAFCGIIGLKPSYGRISRYGQVAYASSFDTIGIFATNIYDCATMLEVIAGKDNFDSTTVAHEVPAYTNALKIDKKIKIACLKQTITYDGLQEEIRGAVNANLARLQKFGHQVDMVDFSLLPYALPTYYVIANAEASSNLARFDGVRFGYRDQAAKTLTELYKKTRTMGFNKEVQRRILSGVFVLADGAYDTCYVQAKKVRVMIKQQLQEILAKYDFILLPTTPTTAFELGYDQYDPVAMYWADVYTTIASIAGLPAISIPSGTDKKGLPIGIQIIGNEFDEAGLLSFAHYLLQLNK